VLPVVTAATRVPPASVVRSVPAVPLPARLELTAPLVMAVMAVTAVTVSPGISSPVVSAVGVVTVVRRPVVRPVTVVLAAMV